MKVFSLMFFTFAVRFFLYSIIEHPVWVLPVELLNGVTFALAYSAAILYAAHLAPPGTEGTLQGIVGTTYNGIGLSVISNINVFNIFIFIYMTILLIIMIIIFFIRCCSWRIYRRLHVRKFRKY